MEMNAAHASCFNVNLESALILIAFFIATKKLNGRSGNRIYDIWFINFSHLKN